MHPKINEIVEAARCLGYAIGILEGLADMGKFTERETDCIDEAVAGLRSIRLLELTAALDGKRAAGNGRPAPLRPSSNTKGTF